MPRSTLVFKEEAQTTYLVLEMEIQSSCSFDSTMAKGGCSSGGEEDGDCSSYSKWSELTHECLTNVLSRLTMEDRWKGPMFVCKSWIQACKDPSLFTVFDLETHFESGVESPLWWSPSFERKIDSMLASVAVWSGEALKEIRVRHCSDRSLDLVAGRCPTLEILSIKSCPNVTDSSMSKIAASCPKLMELDISYCHEVSHESLELIGKKCQDFKILKRNLLNSMDPSLHNGIVPSEYLKTCPQDGNMEAAAIGKFMPNLEHLELRFSKLSAHGLVPLSEGCLKLEYLDLFGCADLTIRDIMSASPNFKNMKKLVKPNFAPRLGIQANRYGHWNLYDERFQPNVFPI